MNKYLVFTFTLHLYSLTLFAQLEEGKKQYFQASFRQGIESLRKETSLKNKDEANYWIGLCYDVLGKRDSSLLIYGSIRPSSPFYWKAQARMSITFTFRADHTKADSLLKSIEEISSNLTLPEYLQARWYYHYQRSDFPKALEFAIKNVKLCEQLKYEHWSALANVDLGMAYSKIPDFKKSIETLEKSVEIQKKVGIKAYLYRTYQGLAGVYQANNVYDKSDTYFKKTLQMSDNITPQLRYIVWLGLTTNAIGRKDFVAAEKYIEKAKEIAKTFLDIQQLAYTHVLEANIKLAKKKYKESVVHFKTAIVIYQKIKDVMGTEWCADGLATVYEKTGDYKQSLKYRKLAQESLNVLRTEEKTKIIEELNSKYETEKKEKLISSQKIKILEEDKKKTSIISISLAATLLLVALFVVYSRRQRLKVIKMQQKFEQTTQQLESFNLTISHELRTPIVQMRNTLASINKRLDTPEIQQIEKSLNEMDTLVQSMLQLSKIETEALHYGSVDTQLLITDILEQITLPSNLSFHFDTLPTVQADVSLLRQVFVNLIQNAIKFTSTQPKALIKIESENQTDRWIFKVQDNGVGFPADKANQLFRLFGRLKNSTSFSGFGVGLVIVKTIVEKHGGRVWAEGQEGKGAIFGFELPQ